MLALTRLYAFVLVLAVAALAAGELVPRGSAGRLSSAELETRLARMASAVMHLEERARRGEVEEDDDVRLQALRDEHAALRRERSVRTARVAVVLGLALLSLVFALVALPAVLLSRSARPRAIEVEVAPDARVAIDPVDVPAEAGRLFGSREEAIEHLATQPPLRCANCGTLWEPEVVGRVGKRILLRRSPDGTASGSEVLGLGWWARPADPSGCGRCGGRELLPDVPR